MRTATAERRTKETYIRVTVNLDGGGEYSVDTGIGFLDHMLEQLSRHSLIDLELKAKGDLHIDFHHTNEDAGIVIGEAVRVRPAAVAHGSLSVTIAEQPQISQPGPFSDGQTVVVPDSRIAVEQHGDGRMFLFDAGVTLAEIVQAVNQVGAAPGDLVAILEALKQAGALRAELVVI